MAEVTDAEAGDRDTERHKSGGDHEVDVILSLAVGVFLAAGFVKGPHIENQTDEARSQDGAQGRYSERYQESFLGCSGRLAELEPPAIRGLLIIVGGLFVNDLKLAVLLHLLHFSQPVPLFALAAHSAGVQLDCRHTTHGYTAVLVVRANPRGVAVRQQAYAAAFEGATVLL